MDALLNRFCCYRPDRNEYFGRVSIRQMIYFSIVLMAFTQLYISIYYLVYHVWWWFIGLFGCVLANAALLYAVQKRFGLVAKAFLVYQILFTLVFLVASIWMLVILCNPYSNSYIYRKCWKEKITKLNWKQHCASEVRIQGAVYFPIFFLFFALNSFCLVVVYNFVKYISRPGLPSYSPNPMGSAPSRPAGVLPPTTTTSSPQSPPPPPTSPGSGGVAALSPGALGQQTTYENTTMGMGAMTTSSPSYGIQSSYIPPQQTTYNAYENQHTTNQVRQQATYTSSSTEYNNQGYSNPTLHAPPLSPVDQHWDTQPQYNPYGNQPERTAADNHLYDTTPAW